MASEFKLPDLGEGVSSGTVGRVMVKSGDSVSANQAIFELETDKAVTEITAPSSMKVVEVKVEEGASVNVGAVLLTYEAGGSDAGETPAKEAPPAEPPAEKPVSADAEAEEEAEASSDQEEGSGGARSEANTKPKGGAPNLKVLDPPAKASERPAPARPDGAPILATPSVRKLAREMGVNLSDVPVSDPSGRVSTQDIINFSKRGAEPAAKSSRAEASSEKAPANSSGGGAPSDDRWGAVTREPMNGVRKKTVQHMTRAWTTIPHVTHFEKADVSGLEAVRKEYGKTFDEKGGKLTVTVFLIKVLAMALKKFPKFNASVDVDNEEIIYKQYCNVGVAVDTPNGLLVPVIRDADRKSVLELSIELPALAAKARERKLALEDMQGGSMTVTNLGGLGGGGFQTFTPIINAPEVAILGVSRAAYEPVFENGAFVPKLRLPLALSYDHRLVDGADAARFMKWYVQALEQPWSILLEA